MTLIFFQSVYVKIICGMSRTRREESKHKKRRTNSSSSITSHTVAVTRASQTKLKPLAITVEK